MLMNWKLEYWIDDRLHGYYWHGLEPRAVLMGEVGARGFEGVEYSATEAPYIRFIQNQETLNKLSAIV